MLLMYVAGLCWSFFAVPGVVVMDIVVVVSCAQCFDVLACRYIGFGLFPMTMFGIVFCRVTYFNPTPAVVVDLYVYCSCLGYVVA